MATLGGILIADKNSELDSGAAFLLSQKCNVSEVVFIDPNWEVEVKEDSPYVVTRFKGAIDANDAFNKGYILVQQGLDILSVTGKDNLSIKNGEDEYLIWWRGEGSEQVLRIITLCRCSIEVSISFASEKPQISIYHESFRYIRLAQITDDLFDAYRNMYLALELLVSTISPKARQESEKNWLKRVIGSSPDYYTEVRIIDEIYKIRCDLFHAKKNESHIIPQKKLNDKKRVSDSLNHLSTLVFKLIRDSQNVRRKTGGIVSSLNEYYGKQSDKIFIILSDDDTPFNINETINSPTFRNSVKMITKYDCDLSEQNFVVFLGSIDFNELQHLSKVARLGLVRGDRIAITEVVRDSLTYNLIDKLEVQMRLYENNETRAFKRFFFR